MVTINRSGTSTVSSFDIAALTTSMFNDLSGLSLPDIQKLQVQNSLQQNTALLLQRYEEQQRQARQAKEAYDQVLRERRISAARARQLTKEQNDLQLRLANYRKEIAGINASQVINNAYSLARAGMFDMQQGIRQTVAATSATQAGLAKAGVEVGKGSAALVIDNITKEGFRQVDNNFADSLNRVNASLAQAFSLKFNAEMDLLATQEQNKLNLKLTDIQTGGTGKKGTTIRIKSGN